MRLKLENIFPLLIIGFLIFTFYYNSRPPSHMGDRKIISPTPEVPKFIRDEGVVDGKVKIKHIPSGDVFAFDYYDGYFMLPPKQDGFPKDTDGKPLWSLDYTKPTYWIDPRVEAGAYAGYLDGDKKGTNINSFDVGLKISPCRLFFNSTTVDGLISNQAAGLGMSFYPSPERFGQVWRNVGIGYGRVYTYEDDKQRNLYYLSFSAHF